MQALISSLSLHSLFGFTIVSVATMFVLKGLSVAAVARPTSHVDFEKSVAEKLSAAPTGWVQDAEEKVDKDATSITLKIHLANKDMDKFQEHAMNVSIQGSAGNK
jgi:tripeptidyl-peptidase-1